MGKQKRRYHHHRHARISSQRAGNEPELVRAAADGDLFRVQQIVRNHHHPASGHHGWTTALLQKASQNGHADVVQWLLRKQQQKCHEAHGDNAADDDDNNSISSRASTRMMMTTPLHLACANGHVKVVKLLLDSGAAAHHNKQTKNEHGWTPLALARHKGHDAVVRLFRQEEEELCRAAARGDLPRVLQYLQNGTHVNAKEDNSGNTSLHAACAMGNEAMVRLLLNHGADVRVKSDHGYTCLHDACTNGHEAIVRLLLDHGADLQATSIYGSTSLYEACWGRHEGIARLLLEHGAEPHVHHHHHPGCWSCLYKACWCGDIAMVVGTSGNGYEGIVRALLEYGADVNATDDNCVTCLHTACDTFNLLGALFAGALLDHGAAMNAMENLGSTALHWACMAGDEPVVTLLLEHGAHVNAKNANGWTPLHWASLWGFNQSIVTRLLQHGANVNARDSSKGLTPLHCASYNGNASIVSLLLDYGALVDATDHDGTTALHLAVGKGRTKTDVLLRNNLAERVWDNHLGHPWENGHEQVAKLLLAQYGANVNAKDAAGWSPLHWVGVADAIMPRDQEALAKVLLVHGGGACINTKDEEDDMTPLHVASRHGNGCVAHLLVRHGAQVNAKDASGWTPLHWAAHEDGAEAVLPLLLTRPGDPVDLKDDDGITPLRLASERGRESLVCYLLRHGANVNGKDNMGITPLTAACQNGHDEVVTLLLEYGAQVNARDGVGWSPLHWAAAGTASEHGATAVLKELVIHGATSEARDDDGRTPFDVASDSGCKALVALSPATMQIPLRHRVNTL